MGSIWTAWRAQSPKSECCLLAVWQSCLSFLALHLGQGLTSLNRDKIRLHIGNFVSFSLFSLAIFMCPLFLWTREAIPAQEWQRLGPFSCRLGLHHGCPPDALSVLWWVSKSGMICCSVRAILKDFTLSLDTMQGHVNYLGNESGGSQWRDYFGIRQ